MEKASYVSDIFFSIVKYGKASGPQLATGLGQVVSTAKTAGLKLEELGASITVLSKIMQSRNAITYLNNMLSKMINPTESVKKKTQEYGIELGLTAVKAKGFNNVLREIYELSKKDQGILLEFFGDARGQRAALQLLGEGYGDLQRQMKNFQNSAGEMEKAYKVIEGNVHVQLAALPETFRRISESAGLTATNILTMGGALQPLLQAINNMGPASTKMAAGVALTIAAFTGYKGVMLTITSLQAMMAKNEQILAGKKAQLATATQALTASDARYAELQKMTNLHTLEEKKKEAIERAKNAHVIDQENLKKQQSIAIDSAGLPFWERNILLSRDGIKLRKSGIDLINAENEAKKQALLLDAMAPKKYSAGITALFTAKNAMENAKNAALNATALRQQAIAVGDLAEANKQATIATRQWAAAQKFSKLVAEAQVWQSKSFLRLLKAMRAARKSDTVETKLSVAWQKLSAKAMAGFSKMVIAARINLVKLGIAIKSLATAAAPMLILSAAIQAVSWAWEQLDLSGEKMLESFRENLSKMEKDLQKRRDMLEKESEREQEYGSKMIEAAKTVAALSEQSSFSKEQFAKIKNLVAQINDYIGESVVQIDEENSRILTQLDLVEKVEKLKRQREEESTKRQLRHTATMRKIYQDQIDKLLSSRTGWNYGEVDAEIASVSAKIEEEKFKAAELHSKLMAIAQDSEIKNLSIIASKNSEILKIKQQIADLEKGYAYEDMTTEQKLSHTIAEMRKSKKYTTPWEEYQKKLASPEMAEYKKQKAAFDAYEAEKQSLDKQEKNIAAQYSNLEKERNALQQEKEEVLKKAAVTRSSYELGKSIVGSYELGKSIIALERYEREISILNDKKAALDRKAEAYKNERAAFKQREEVKNPKLPQYLFSPREQAEAVARIGKELPRVAFNEKEYQEELLNYTKLAREREKLERKLYEERKRQGQELERKFNEQRTRLEKEFQQNISHWEQQRFENSLKFAKDDDARISILKNEEKKYVPTPFTKGDKLGGNNAEWNKRLMADPEKAMADFQTYYSLVARRYEIQNQQEKALAAAAKKANEEMIRLISSMDRFKSSAAEGVSANSVEALRLTTRRFNAMPDFTAYSTKTYDSAQESRNQDLQKLTANWKDLLTQTLGQTKRQWAVTEKTIAEMLKKIDAEKTTEEVKRSIEGVKNTLEKGIKVSVTNETFELHTVH